MEAIFADWMLYLNYP